MSSFDWSHSIKALIEQKGYTEKNIADFAKTTQATINYLKNGVIQEPKYGVGSKIVNLCAINGVDLKEKPLATANS